MIDLFCLCVLRAAFDPAEGLVICEITYHACVEGVFVGNLDGHMDIHVWGYW